MYGAWLGPTSNSRASCHACANMDNWHSGRSYCYVVWEKRIRVPARHDWQPVSATTDTSAALVGRLEVERASVTRVMSCVYTNHVQDTARGPGPARDPILSGPRDVPQLLYEPARGMP